MEVSVKLASTFAKYQRGRDTGRFVLREGATVLDLVRELGVPEDHVRIIAVNGKQESLDKVLTQGDSVFLFPPAFGGG
jgi:molybdopterin converting factor small subunit